MLLGQNFCRLQREHRHSAVANNGCVLAGPFDVRHAQRDDIIAWWYCAELSVRRLVLDEDYRVVAANSGLEQALCVVRCRGHYHIKPRRMHKPGLERL
ncbi:hypothetical protein ES703_61314 [subsurface metagenome]